MVCAAWPLYALVFLMHLLQHFVSARHLTGSMQVSFTDLTLSQQAGWGAVLDELLRRQNQHPLQVAVHAPHM